MCGEGGLGLDTVRRTKYARAVYDPIFKATKTPDGQLEIELDKEVAGLDLYYSFDNSFPDYYYPKIYRPAGSAQRRGHAGSDQLQRQTACRPDDRDADC
jgi:hypothetical protein